MANTRQSSYMSTAESYTNRPESAAVTDFDRSEAKVGTIEEATAIAHAEAIFAPMATNHGTIQAQVDPDYPSSFISILRMGHLLLNLKPLQKMTTLTGKRTPTMLRMTSRAQK